MDPSVEQQAMAAALYGGCGGGSDARSKDMMLCLVCGDRARYSLLHNHSQIVHTLEHTARFLGLLVGTLEAE